jgi:nitrogen fixation protein NifQ
MAIARTYQDLLACARFAGADLTLAFAGVIGNALQEARRPLIRGLDNDAFNQLIDIFFPGAELDNGTCAGLSPPYDEFDDLVELLLESRTEPTREGAWLSYAIASAAMGENHLWQDMGLSDRNRLSQLMMNNYAPLARRNLGDMKWKKFFYRQLCERAHVPICKSPHCASCVDYGICFGPEEGVPAPGLLNSFGTGHEQITNLKG